MTQARNGPPAQPVNNNDELTRRYREASAQDSRRPGPQVRDAVRAHAQMVLTTRQPTADTVSDALIPRPAANQSRWKISLLASIALVGLTGLLVLQFERGTPEEKELAFGVPSPTAEKKETAGATGKSSPTAITAATAPATAGIEAAKPALPTSPSVQKPSADGSATAQAEAKPSAKAAANNAPPKTASAAAEPQTSATPPAAASAQNSEAEAVTTRSRQEMAAVPPRQALPVPPSPPSPPPAPVAAPAPAAAPPAAARENSSLADSAVVGQAREGIAQAPAAAAQPSPAPTMRIAPPAPYISPAPAAAAAPAAPPPPAITITPSGKAETSPSAYENRARLAKQISPLNTRLHEAARAGRVAQIETLVRQQGAAINAPDEAGRTALMLAVMSGQTAAVQRLLALGANPALTDRDGLSALQYAQRLGFGQIEKMLEAAR